MDSNNIAVIFNEIYDEYHKRIYHYFRKDFGKEDSEDLTQQVFTQLWMWLPNKYNIKNRKSLIYTIAKNVKLDRFRQNSISLITLLPENFDISDDNNAYNIIDYKLSIHKLSIKEQNLLIMSLRGYNSNEIGEQLGISPSAVRTRLQKIRKKLK